MIIGSLLIAGFAAVTQAKLYYQNQALNLPLVENLSVQDLGRCIGDANPTEESLSKLNFSKVETPMEVMSLPLEFFKTITPEQVQQILLNGAIKSLFDGEFLSSVRKTLKDKTLMEDKLETLFVSLGILTPLTAGDKTDVIVAKVPTRLYSYLNPVFALSAATFQTSIRGFTRLLHLTKLTLRQLATVAKAAIMRAIKKLVSLPIEPGRVFAVLQILLNVVGAYAGLGPVASRVLEITKQLGIMALQLNSKADLAIKAIKSLNAKNNKVKTNLPRAKAQSDSRETGTHASCPYLDQDGEVEYGKCPWAAGLPVSTVGNCPLKNPESLENCAWLKEHAANCPWFLGEPIVRGDKTCPWLESGNAKVAGKSTTSEAPRHVRSKSSKKSSQGETRRSKSKSSPRKSTRWSSESISEVSSNKNDGWTEGTRSKAVSGARWTKASESKSLNQNDDGWSSSSSRTSSGEPIRKSRKHSHHHSRKHAHWA
ncbi:hypothetical protein PSACC_02779 [Paramicrosporidium saccamoebae]|uniref:Uncharacterized protein n=1 Tax=Paramicrosporidium saccamoebae TaxID=1246581 RepID=A0A2H9TI38_9FUNG|nr:hypothetical protein PSACC_02779 [Paramicrosporidium saccamoebae]